MDGDTNHDEKGLRIPFYTLQDLLPIFEVNANDNPLIFRKSH